SMHPRSRTWSAASSTSPSPRAATTRSTPSAATACSSSPCHSRFLEPNAAARVDRVAVFFMLMTGIFKFALAVAMAVVAFSAYAQLDAAQMAAAREKAQVCAECHGPDGNSQNPDYPILAGQSWRYIYIELKDFQEGRRSDPQMSPVAARLSRDDMVALGNFFAAQKPLPIKFQADGAKVE